MWHVNEIEARKPDVEYGEVSKTLVGAQYKRLLNMALKMANVNELYIPRTVINFRPLSENITKRTMMKNSSKNYRCALTTFSNALNL